MLLRNLGGKSSLTILESFGWSLLGVWIVGISGIVSLVLSFVFEFLLLGLSFIQVFLLESFWDIVVEFIVRSWSIGFG